MSLLQNSSFNPSARYAEEKVARLASCGPVASTATVRRLLLSTALLSSLAAAQTIHFDDGSALSPAKAQHVIFSAEPVVLKANQPDWIELRFHIEPGFHINSHSPTDGLLIPTTLKLAPSPNLRVLGDVYPAGSPLQLHIGAGETLSAYTGDVLLRVHVVAQRGDSTLTGTLRYQACDTGSCFPPHDLPVSLPLSVR